MTQSVRKVDTDCDIREWPRCHAGAVLLIASYAPSLWTFRRQLIATFIRRGYRVVTCAPPHDKAEKTLRALGAEFLPIGPTRTSLNPISDLRYFFRLMRICRRERPHAVIAYTAKPVIWGGLAAAAARVENSVSMITGLGFAFTNTEASRSLLSRLVEGLYRFALRRSDSVVFQNSDDLKEFMQRRLISAESKTFVVNGSGVDLGAFRPTPLPDVPVFLLVARLLRDKGVREYCEAAARLKSRYPQASFRLVGWFDADNPRAIRPAELRRWCDRAVVEYRGAVEDVRPEMAECRVYVLPSYREGTPRTVLEAMAMARPIITTDTPGCRETVRNQWNGYLVPARDSAALAQAMESFITCPHLAHTMGANSRILAESKYDALSVAESILTGAGL